MGSGRKDPIFIRVNSRLLGTDVAGGFTGFILVDIPTVTVPKVKTTPVVIGSPTSS